MIESNVTVLSRKPANAVLLTLHGREYVLSVNEADNIGSALKNAAFSASAAMALRSAWMECAGALRAVREAIELPDALADLVDEALQKP